MNLTHGIVRRNQLTKQELEEIKALQEVCETHDTISLKLNWSMLRDRADEHDESFLYYAEGKLAGFLALYYFGRDEMEASGMVHPEQRRRGIYTELVKTAQEECIKRNISKLIFICPGHSASGHAFCEQNNSVYSFSEYYMERNGDCLVDAPNIQDFVIRKAYTSDAASLSLLNQEAFDMSAEAADQFAEFSLEKGNTLVADWNGEIIGKLNIREKESHAFLYGFAVAAKHRGKGYGRIMLLHSIAYSQTMMGKMNQSLEVAAANSTALGLYVSCGFKEQNKIDYYEMKQGKHF
ncbi:GNAT family N-acetyltransferase [Fictibacillus iocasae]|uniref:GNAT family N-acetyltransferase n=1 Tax=Fictibacillus iocasae TaxID=2715437 RepID=A0ABW2NLJ2_9BACL